MAQDTLYAGPRDVADLTQIISNFVEGEWIELVIFTHRQKNGEFETELQKLHGTRCKWLGRECAIELGTMHLTREFPMLSKVNRTKID